MNRIRSIVLVVLVAVACAITGNAQTVADLKEHILDLQNSADLGFQSFTLCRQIVSYGQYVPYEANEVKAGSTIYFYYEPRNIYTARRDGKYYVQYTQDMILLSDKGKVLLESLEALVFRYESQSPVLDLYATNSLDLGRLDPGWYVFKAVIHDKLRGAGAETLYRFRITE